MNSGRTGDEVCQNAVFTLCHCPTELKQSKISQHRPYRWRLTNLITRADLTSYWHLKISRCLSRSRHTYLELTDTEGLSWTAFHWIMSGHVIAWFLKLLYVWILLQSCFTSLQSEHHLQKLNIAEKYCNKSTVDSGDTLNTHFPG